MRSLQGRMFVVFALIATLPLMALSYLAWSETHDALSKEVGVAHRDAIRAAAGFVDVYIENGRVLIGTETRSPVFGGAYASGDPEDIADAISEFAQRATYQDARIFHSVIALDTNGTVIAAWPPDAGRRGSDLAEKNFFIAPTQTGELRTLPATGGANPILPFGAPVVVNGTLRGVFVANLGLDALGARLQAFAPTPGQQIYLTDRSGTLLAHPNVTHLGSDWSGVVPVANAIAGKTGFLEYTNPVDGVRSLGAYAPIGRLQWAAVDSVPLDVAYAGLTRLTAVLVVLSGILAGGILLASVIVARHIVQPVQELTTAAGALSAGQLRTRIKPRSDDEIGELAVAFNDMADRIGESLDGLRRSEARYRSLVESANDLIFTIQTDGTFSFVSSHARALLGREPIEIVGEPAHTHIVEGDRLVFLDNVRHVLERGEPILWVPLRFLTRGQGTRMVIVNFSPIFDQGDRPARVLCVAHDVTQQRRQELIRDKAFQMARLVSEQAALEPLANRGLVLLLAVVSLSKGATYIGPADKLSEVATANLDRGSASERGALRSIAQRAIRQNAPARVATAGGDALAIPLVEQGEPLGAVVLVGAAHDLTDENVEVLTALASQLAVGIRRTLFEARLKEYAAELEDRVRDRTAELTEKSREMESFLYSVSHDLKAPLISIQGYAQSIQEDLGPALGEEGATYLDRIRKNASLMESLILDILELSRIGRVRERVESVPMRDVFREVGARLSDGYHALGGRLELPADAPVVIGEAKRLTQLFNNLLDNAMKYRHPGRPPVARVTARKEGDMAVFEVHDNGRGVPPDAVARLFEMFQRIHTRGMEDPGGTGMGLAIVKRIVDTHGGEIDVTSVEGEGMTFIIRLPIAPEAVA